MNTLFGIEMPLFLRVVIAFLLVIGLIALFYYVARRFGAGALNAAAAVRGRQPRLAVTDSAPVDGRRRLLLIRRDNVEHLLMIGGPTDVLVESNIVRATAAATAREAAPARAADILPRPVPLADSGAWPLQPEPAHRETTPREAMQRDITQREPMQRSPRTASPPTPPPAPDDAAAAWSMHPEAAPRTVPDSEPRVIPEREPRPIREPRIGRDLRIAAEREPRMTAEREPRVAMDSEPRIAAEREPRAAAEREPRAAPASASRAQSLERPSGPAADASRNRVEPALTSEPAAPPPPPPAAARSAEPRRPPPVPVQPLSETEEQNLAEMALQLESALQRQRPAAAPAVAPPAPPRPEAKPPTKPEIKLEVKVEATPERKPEAKPAAAAKPAAKPPFDDLEQEMASLLGRPSGKG